MQTAAAAAPTRKREDVPPQYRWNLEDIFPTWEAWDVAYASLERKIDEYAALKGSLAQGAPAVRRAFELADEIGQLEYRVWYYPSLRYDEDQRDNAVNARKQRVQILFAKLAQAASWFDPELLAIPLETVRTWMAGDDRLARYRFAIERLYHQQEHVLDEKGEKLLSLSSRLSSAPNDSYWALSTADAR